LPNHCFAAKLEPASANEFDFTVKFNRDMDGITNVAESSYDTTSKATSYLCDIQRTADSNLPTGAGLTDNVSRRMLSNHPGGGGGGGSSAFNLDVLSAIALSGVPILNGLSADSVDAVENEYETMDICLSHSTPSPSNLLHYHSWSPCILNEIFVADSSTDYNQFAPELCEDDAACYNSDNETAWDNIKSLSLAGYPSGSGRNRIIGLAKDGHVVYGPPDDGEWACEEHDFCNGKTFDDGHYAYLSTGTFPYLVGCWGPAESVQEFEVTCSNWGCGGVQTTTTTPSDSNTTTDDSAQILKSATSLVLFYVLFFSI